MQRIVEQNALYRPKGALQVMIAVDEALRRLEVSAPERNAILEAFRYADARNAAAMATAVAAAQQEAAEAAVAAGDHQQAPQPVLTSKPLTRWDHSLHSALRLPSICAMQFCQWMLTRALPSLVCLRNKAWCNTV